MSWSTWIANSLGFLTPLRPETQKTDVAEHPQVFDYAGLLVDRPPGAARLPFISSTDSEAICTALALHYAYCDTGHY